MSFDAFFLIGSDTFVNEFLFDVVEYDFCSGLSKSSCESESDSIRCSCYKGNLTFE